MTDKTRPSLEKGSWKDGPIAMTGNWEPLIFWRRLGGGRADVAQRYHKEHTEVLVRRLKEWGVNLYITHYHKGFGLKAEAEDIANARKLIRLCHRHGIKVGGYIGDTMVLETFLAEEPDAGSWHQVGPDGTEIHYGGTQTFRFRWCRTNPAYLAYMKKILTQGLHDGLDLIHFDNFVDKPEPFSCHCRWCTEEFRTFLLSTLTEQERKERFGFSDVSRVVPPVFSTPLYVEWNLDTIVNPLLQEWVNFRCHILADRYRQLAEFSRTINPDVSIECNPSGIWGENTAYMRGVHHAALLPSGEFFWDESPNPYGLLENGALCTHLRTMKMGEPLGNRVFYYSALTEHALAEGLAFNRGCLGMVAGVEEDTPTGNAARCRAYTRLVSEYPDLFCRTKSMARVAVYRNYSSFAWNSVEPQLQAIFAEQTFLENHIPFDIISRLDNLSYRAIILPGTECITRKEVARLKAFVARGGCLILTGSAGKYDGWRRELPRNPFAEIRSGKGRVVLLPALETPSSAPPLDKRVVWDSYYRVIDARYWLLPRNADQLLRALKNAGVNAAPCSVKAPRMTAVEPRMAEDGTLVLHVLHYDAKTLKEKIGFSCETSQTVAGVSLLSPGKKEKAVPFMMHGKTIVFSVVTDGVYGLARVKFNAEGKGKNAGRRTAKGPQ